MANEEKYRSKTGRYLTELGFRGQYNVVGVEVPRHLTIFPPHPERVCFSKYPARCCGMGNTPEMPPGPSLRKATSG